MESDTEEEFLGQCVSVFAAVDRIGWVTNEPRNQRKPGQASQEPGGQPDGMPQELLVSKGHHASLGVLVKSLGAR